MQAHVLSRTFIVIALLLSLPAMPQQPSPLVLLAQGSFFVGGENKTIQEPATPELAAQSGDITVNQMYVQYQIPMDGDKHLPVVMVHGCCLSSKEWETTPDGRAGWSEYFVRRDHSVYLADQVSRARSGFDPTAFYNVRLGTLPLSDMPIVDTATHEMAWTMFRFGPRFGVAFADQQFPMEAIAELYKQLIPDLNSTVTEHPNPNWVNMADLGVRLNGAVLIGHSESGFFPERAALIRRKGVRGIVSIETECDTKLTNDEMDALASIPILIMFGDHLGDVSIRTVSGNWSWADAMKGCMEFTKKIKDRGGDAEVVHLPTLGIRGNSHMLMQDRNSDQLADIVLKWIDRHAESKAKLSFTAGQPQSKAIIKDTEHF
jgi:hypothetical protein